MLRVGLFLASQPFDGGAFQYSQCVLRAFVDDPPGDISAVVAYTNDAWRAALQPLPVESLPLTISAFDELLLKLVKFNLIPLPLWLAAGSRLNRTVRSVRDQDCDIWIFPSQDAWSYFLPVPSIVSIFDLMHRYERRFPEVSHGMKFLRRESHYKKICRYSAGLLVDSAVGREHVEVSYSVDRERVHVLPFIAPPHLDDVHDERDTLEVPGKFLFYPAQFWRHKNHIRLIRALAGLTDRCPDMQLVLAGSRKNNFEAVRNLISDLGLTDRVHILGYVSDPQIVSLYRRARALIMPTFFGPTNIPPLEAMALGCPVAASNIYAMPEQLGGAALMFDPNSVDDIAEAMYRLWTDDALCAELSRKGLERNAAWTQAEFSARLLSIVRRVAGSMARPRR